VYSLIFSCSSSWRRAPPTFSTTQQASIISFSPPLAGKGYDNKYLEFSRSTGSSTSLATFILAIPNPVQLLVFHRLKKSFSCLEAAKKVLLYVSPDGATKDLIDTWDGGFYGYNVQNDVGAVFPDSLG